MATKVSLHFSRDCIHSFNKDLLGLRYMLCLVLCVGNTVPSKRDTDPVLIMRPFFKLVYLGNTMCSNLSPNHMKYHLRLPLLGSAIRNDY